LYSLLSKGSGSIIVLSFLMRRLRPTDSSTFLDPSLARCRIRRCPGAHCGCDGKCRGRRAWPKPPASSSFSSDVSIASFLPVGRVRTRPTRRKAPPHNGRPSNFTIGVYDGLFAASCRHGLFAASCRHRRHWLDRPGESEEHCPLSSCVHRDADAARRSINAGQKFNDAAQSPRMEDGRGHAAGRATANVGIGATAPRGRP
jgi:hypothetical protein